MKNKFLIMLLLLFFIKEILLVTLVPLWHFPDEQAHFAQVAYIAEKGSSPDGNNYDLTKEIYLSEKYLGTKRDKSGNNKFTFHPEYRLPYADNLTGIHEKEIQNLTKDSKNRQMVDREASRYPPFYYLVLSVSYRLQYYQGLIIRVFTARLVQLIFSLGTVYLAYQIGGLIFGNNRLVSVSLVILVALHPMFSFVSAGINSDNIGNFIFSLFLFISLQFIKCSLKMRRFLALLLISLMAVFIKPQLYITLPFCLLLSFLKLVTAKLPIIKKLKLLTLFIFVFVLAINYLIRADKGPFLIAGNIFKIFSYKGLVEQIGHYSLLHLYREVLPWYWGIYDWLGVTYPRPVHRLINMITFVSLIGLLVFLIRNFRRLHLWPVNGLLYLIVVNVFYLLGIYLFDWLQYAQSGYKFHIGVQGRYFFPLIISHLLFILIGWRELFRFLPNLVDNAAKTLVLLMILLHWYAVYTIAKTYYDLSSINTFIIQAGQYKPWFFKGIYLVSLIILALTANLLLLIKYLHYPADYDQKNKTVI